MSRPQLRDGYLGQQPKFTEFGLSTFSHNNPEITADTNEVEIKLKTTQAMKVTCNLIKADTDEEFRDRVFTQTLDDVVSLLIAIPSAGWYKLQVYALPASDDSKTLPGVYNYLINCTDAPKQIYNYPKQYAQWKQGCFIYHPVVLQGVTDLKCTPFKVRIPNAQAVAVTVEGEWSQLNQSGQGVWEGTANLASHQGKDVKVALNANFGGDSCKYCTLLEYAL